MCFDQFVRKGFFRVRTHRTKPNALKFQHVDGPVPFAKRADCLVRNVVRDVVKDNGVGHFNTFARGVATTSDATVVAVIDLHLGNGVANRGSTHHAHSFLTGLVLDDHVGNGLSETRFCFQSFRRFKLIAVADLQRHEGLLFGEGLH
jgi:hypothetical protein